MFRNILFVIYVLIVSSYSLSTDKTILIIGGTGRVGQATIKSLIHLDGGIGKNLVFLVRKLSDESKMKFPSNSKLIEGDVSNMNALLQATTNCDIVIDVHGMKPPRFTKLSDIFRHPKYDPSHPYNGKLIIKNKPEYKTSDCIIQF